MRGGKQQLQQLQQQAAAAQPNGHSGEGERGGSAGKNGERSPCCFSLVEERRWRRIPVPGLCHSCAGKDGNSLSHRGATSRCCNRHGGPTSRCCNRDSGPTSHRDPISRSQGDSVGIHSLGSVHCDTVGSQGDSGRSRRRGSGKDGLSNSSRQCGCPTQVHLRRDSSGRVPAQTHRWCCVGHVPAQARRRWVCVRSSGT